MLFNNLGYFLFQFFLLLILRLNQMLESFIVIFLVLNGELLLKLFSFLMQIFVGFLLLWTFSIATNYKRLSHKFLHFIIEIFLSRIFEIVEFQNYFLKLAQKYIHSKCLIIYLFVLHQDSDWCKYYITLQACPRLKKARFWKYMIYNKMKICYSLD